VKIAKDILLNAANEEIRFDYGVVGLGKTGRSMVNFLLSQGFSVLGADSCAQSSNVDRFLDRYPDVPTLLGDSNFDFLSVCEELIFSPGVDKRSDIFKSVREANHKIKGDIEIFADYADAPVIGITGTNGKSTVTTMVSLMLKASGLQVRYGGNLGTPAIELLGGEAPDCYVLELSSFQLDLVENLQLDVACILNVTADHLDRHKTFDCYLEAKKKILENSKYSLVNSGDESLACFANRREIKGFSHNDPSKNNYGIKRRDGTLFLGSISQEFLAAEELSVPGDHNYLNSIAALGIVDIFLGSVPDQAIQTLKQFRGLPHRGQVIGQKNGVEFIDDSKATNTAAAMASILSIRSSESLILIAGGATKGVSYLEFVEQVVSHLRAAVLLGETALEIKQLFADRIECVIANTMSNAVISAMNLARTGDKVLLAPACSSTDMFDDYRHRGLAFQSAVAALGELN
jgi:UDP-N-acetylmuramoylalanine--D-glutamate ligase